MILVTGGTGFIGQALTKSLVSLGYPVRLLLNPASDYPKLPKGVPVEIAISSINDVRNLRAAMKDVQIVFHLVGTEWNGIYTNYEDVDIRAAQQFSEVAAQMKIERFFFLSHLGADRSSAYSVLRSKAEAESYIQSAGVPYTIIRSAPVYGKGDHFTEVLLRYLKINRLAVPIPGGDACRIQPLWIEDLVTCLLLCLDNQKTINQVLSIGGMEMLTFEECIHEVMISSGLSRRTISLPPMLLRSLIIACEQWFDKFPPMYFWLDYFAEDRLVPLDVLPREFGLMPTRMSQNMDYLVSRKKVQ